MPRTRARSFLCLWLAASTAITGCRTPGPATKTTAPPVATTSQPLSPTSANADRPAVDLAAPEPLAVSFVTGTTTPADAVIEPLSPAETAALLARMESLPDLTKQNATPPTMKPTAPPPVVTGTTAPITFVRPLGKPVADGPLNAPTFAPAGPVAPLPLEAPQIYPRGELYRTETEIRVVFSEAMVPVAKVGEAVVPNVTIDPPLSGVWQWQDTRVLRYVLDEKAATGRLAGSTTFSVMVPAGTRSIAGRELAQNTVSTFSTPTIDMKRVIPARARPDSAIAIPFTQKLDGSKLAPFVSIKKASKNAKDKTETRIPYRVVTRAEAEAAWKKLPDFDLKTLVDDGNVVYVMPLTRWPAGQQLFVALDKGAPSAEGPLVGTSTRSGAFDVVAPFSIAGIECGPKVQKANIACPAWTYASVELTNDILPASYRSEKVQVVGQPFADNKMYGKDARFWVPDVVGKRFEISIGDGLTDRYGQLYVGPKRIAFTTTKRRWEADMTGEAGMRVLDPRFQIPQWVIAGRSMASIRVDLYTVTPADYFAYAEYEEKRRATPPGTKVWSRSFPIGAENGADIRVDLRPGLTDGVGHVVGVATAIPIGGVGTYFPSRMTTWMQVTKLGMTARYDGEKLSAWTRDISPTRFLQPVAKPTLQILREGSRTASAQGQGDEEGHATAELPTGDPKKQVPSLAVSSVGSDSTFIAFTKDREQRSALTTWYVTDDRFIYKPGETLYVKGWVRKTHDGVNPDLSMPKAGDAVTWSLTDARSNALGKGSATLSDQGGFDMKIDLPATAALGQATLSLVHGTDDTSHPIKIQEFKTPNFGVNLIDDVQFIGAVPVYAGEQIAMRAEASYYAGGGLPGAPVSWRSELAIASYAPPSWQRYRFTPPRKRSARSYWDYEGDSEGMQDVTVDSREKLSGGSTSEALLSIGTTLRGRPNILRVETTVTDVDRSTIRAESRPIVVHPSKYYVGLHAAAGEGKELDVIVTDVDGNAVAGVPIDIELLGVLGSERFRDDAIVKDAQRCTLTSKTEPVVCAYARKDEKFAYTATAKIADERGRKNAAQLDLPWWAAADSEDLSITADRPMYHPGETAKIVIKSKSLPATAVVTIARNGIVRDQVVSLTKPSTTIEIPIDPAFPSNVHVLVDRWSVRTDTLPDSKLPIPTWTGAEIEIDVDVEGARLDLTTASTKKLVEPGAQATFTVQATKDGAPVANAEVALMVIDEAVLALTNGRHTDPLPGFYQDYDDATEGIQTLDLVRDEGDVLAGTPGFEKYLLETAGYGTIGTGRYGTGSGYGVGAGSGRLAGRSPSISSRKDFRPVAVFSPVLRTDANGKASVSMKMPDNLTRWRIVAIGTAKTRWFGKGENTIVTRRSINARTMPPRFLTQGDQFGLPVIVQNLDSKPRTIDVAVRAANLTSTGITGQRVTLPAGQRAEVRFAFATLARGTAAIQTAVASDAESDASTVNVAVYAPATTESFATYGVVDTGAALEQLSVPADVFADVGGVELEVASTQMQALTDAYWYLNAYPYECAEQRSSRMLANAAVSDVLEAFAAPGRPTKAELAEQRTEDLAKLTKDQLHDGSWGYFPRMKSDPYVTTQVLAALVAYDAKGEVREKAIGAVDKLATDNTAALTKVAASAADRRDTSAVPYQLGVAASALSSLAAAKTPGVRQRAERLHALATKLAVYPIDVKARLLAIVAGAGPMAMRATLTKDLLNASSETAAGATINATYIPGERHLLPSINKTTALALDALIREAPKHAMIEKLARGLLAARRLGRWRTTQENVVVLSALKRYFATYEAAVPAFTAKLWLGTAGYAEQSFAGRSTARTIVKAGWPELTPGQTHGLALQKDGAGRMYYRVGITYAPKQSVLPALDAGFIVRRTYIPLDDPRDVELRADGTVHIKLGARVQVVLEASSTGQRTQVALVDPLPAGLEAVNTALKTSERAASTTGDSRWDYRATRATRVEGFVDDFAPGVHRMSYTARAVTPGTFIAAPTKAEEMYAPETFGRSASSSVVIQ